MDVQVGDIIQLTTSRDLVGKFMASEVVFEPQTGIYVGLDVHEIIPIPNNELAVIGTVLWITSDDILSK